MYKNNALKSTILMLRSLFETGISEEEYYDALNNVAQELKNFVKNLPTIIDNFKPNGENVKTDKNHSQEGIIK